MKHTKYTEAQIVDARSQAVNGEMTARDVCRIHGISEQTFYRWKRRYGDLQVSEMRRRRELEAENACSRGCSPSVTSRSTPSGTCSKGK